MPSLVIDASVASAWCFRSERSDYTEAVLEAVLTKLEAAAPAILAYELRNTVLTGVRRQRISRDDVAEFLNTFRRLPIHLTEPVSYDYIFDLALRHQLTYYDAAYLDLALREALPLASLDDALCGAARACGVELFRPQLIP
jgi:predicted nucleic acid-binding protein